MKKRLLLSIISLFVILSVVGITFLLNVKNDKEEIIENKERQEEYKQFNKEQFCFNDSFLSYEDENYTSLQGIDVSEFDGIVDYEKVKESGIDFVIIRLGRRGYQTGEIHIDYHFYDNYVNAMENNLLVGVYFFSQAINEEEAIDEANFVLDTLDGLKLDLGIAYDFEEIGEDEARGDDLNKEQVTKNALAFFKTIKTSKYSFLLYASNNSFNKYFDMEKLKDIPIWYAQYYIEPECKHDIFIWQYSEKGTIDNMIESVDMNIMFIKKTIQ